MRSAPIPDRRTALTAAFALALILLAPATASGAVASPERGVAFTAFDSANKGVTAPCPAGKRLLGGGANLALGSGEVVLDDIAPNAALTGFTAYGAEDGNGFAGNWDMGAYTICATPPPGLQLVTTPGPANSANKSITATCPTGKRVVGAGGDITGGGGQVELDDITPNAALTTVTVYGAEDGDGTAANWNLRAFAICANPVAGLERVARTTASTSAAKDIEARCPAGKDLLGTGGEIAGGGGQVSVHGIVPLDNPASRVSVRGVEDQDGTAANWTLTAYAICANGSQRVVEQTATASEFFDSVDPPCPTGKRPTGGGAEITGGLGEVVLHDLVPSEDDLYAAAYEDGTETNRNWSLRAYAICATPLPGQQVVRVESGGSSANKSVTAPCPAGKRVVGAGGYTFNTAGQAPLDDVAPNAALTEVTATAAEDGDGLDAGWNVGAYAVCANPPPGLQRVSASSAFNADEIKTLSSTCPAGKNLLGTGHELTGASGRVVIDDLRPDAGLTATTVTGIATEFGNPNDWNVTAYAICANP